MQKKQLTLNLGYKRVGVRYLAQGMLEFELTTFCVGVPTPCPRLCQAPLFITVFILTISSLYDSNVVIFFCLSRRGPLDPVDYPMQPWSGPYPGAPPPTQGYPQPGPGYPGPNPQPGQAYPGYPPGQPYPRSGDLRSVEPGYYPHQK